MAQLLNVVNQDLESRMDAFNSLSLDVVINGEIKHNLNLEEAVALGRSKSVVEDHLSNKVLSASGLLDLSIIDKNSTTYSTRAVYHLPRDFVLEQSDVFQQASKYNGALVWLPQNSILDQYAKDPNSFISRMPGVRAAAIIKDYTRGEVLGLLMLSLQDDYFFKINYSNKKLETVKMFLVSPDGSVSLPFAGTQGELSKYVMNQLDFSKASNATLLLQDEEQKVVSFIKNNAMGWFLVSTALTSDINRSFSSVAHTLVFTLLFSVLASMFLAWASTVYSTRGIWELVYCPNDI